MQEHVLKYRTRTTRLLQMYDCQAEFYTHMRFLKIGSPQAHFEGRPLNHVSTLQMCVFLKAGWRLSCEGWVEIVGTYQRARSFLHIRSSPNLCSVEELYRLRKLVKKKIEQIWCALVQPNSSVTRGQRSQPP